MTIMSRNEISIISSVAIVGTLFIFMGVITGSQKVFAGEDREWHDHHDHDHHFFNDEHDDDFPFFFHDHHHHFFFHPFFFHHHWD